MANKQKNGESMVDLHLVVSVSEENRFDQYIDRHNLESRRKAFVQFLSQAEEREEKKEVMETAGDKETKDDGGKAAATKGKGRKGKKVVDDVPEEVEVKNGDDISGDEEEMHQKKTGKRAPAKKAPARKGKQQQQEAAAAADTPDVNNKLDATYEVKEAVVDETIGKKPAKKGAKVKKAEAIAEESDENVGQNGDKAAAEKMQSPKSPKAAAKSDVGDAAEGKKRRGKAAAAAAPTGEENVAETAVAPAARRGVLKKPSASSMPEGDEEKEKEEKANPRRGAALKKISPVADTAPEGGEEKQEVEGDAKAGRGKRKKANEKAQGAATEQPESGAIAAVKPKRGRGAKAKKGVEEEDDDA